MKNQRTKKITLLALWSIIYIVLCIIIINFIGLDFDFKNRYIQNSYCVFGLLSIPLWFTLLLKFSKKDGTVFRNTVVPSFFWSLSFFLIGPNILFIILGFLCMGVWFFIYNPTYFLFQISQPCFFTLLSLVIIAIGLQILHNHELRRSRIRYNHIAILRTLYCITITTIGYSFLTTGIAKGYSDISSFILTSKSKDISFIEWGNVIFITFVNILPGILIVNYCRHNLKFLLYAEESYYLYLRSFLFDKKEDNKSVKLPSDRKTMRIGDPSTQLFPKFLSKKSCHHDVMFLPTHNWKKHLDYYIYKSFSVVCVVDNTQGVVWEMFHHSEYYHKIVFYVHSNETLRNLEAMISENKEKKLSPILYHSISQLNQQQLNAPFIFWLKGNRCYYNTDTSILASLLSTKLGLTSEYFIDIDASVNETTAEKTSISSEPYKNWDIASAFLLHARKALSFINTKLPLTMFYLIIIGLTVFWTWLLAKLTWGSIKTILKGDLLPGIIAISLGWGITALNIFVLMKKGHK